MPTHFPKPIVPSKPKPIPISISLFLLQVYHKWRINNIIDLNKGDPSPMFKGIIQKIILNTFGKFVKGIEKEKLSVDLFSGNFKLENISLNHQFFNGLNSPITLAFSSIGTLNLQASLSKLSSVPVECVLDNIFVICQFRETQEVKDSPQTRKDRILKEVSEVFEATLKKLKEEKKEDGMMARLGKKILDNLQLKIMNVHVRFQEGNRHGNSSYAWGLTLQEINLTTTDGTWKPSFIQRNGESKEKLFKMLQVKKLNIYWESGSASKLVLLKEKEHSDEIRKTRLAEMIKEDKQVVLSITSEFKLTINPQEDLQSPLYELDVGLEPIKFQLQRLQLQQMMDFARKNIMQNQLIVKSIVKKSKSKITQEDKCILKEQFEDYISQSIDIQQGASQANNSNRFDQRLEEIFEKIEESELKLWALGPIKRKIKTIRQMQLKKKKSGWFSRGDNQLTQQQQEQLEKYIDSTFQSATSNRDSKCLFFRIKIQLKGGRMLLIEHKGEEIEEQIQFNIGRIFTLISKSQDKSYFQSFIEIASINLNLFIPIQRDNITKKKKLEIFTSQRPQQYKQESQEDSMESFDSAQEEQRSSFLKLNYKNELLEGGTILKRTVDGHMERVTIIYKKIYMQKFRKFFTFRKGATFVKSNSLEKIETEQQGESMEDSGLSFKLQKIFDVKLTINSPVFICPLNERECWCLNLGKLSINSNRNEEFQEYPMKITSAFLRYYPFMKECFDLNKKYVKKGVFSLINDMDFHVNYQRFKKLREEILNIELPSFKVNFTQKQYENLMSLEKVFRVEESEKKTMVEILKEERRTVEQNKVYEGFILKKHETLMSWKDFYGILSGQYLYLYNDNKELKQNCKISIKNAKIIIKQSGSQGDQDNLEIQITNQSQICYLGCQTMQELLKWKLQLDKKNRQFKTIHELIKDYEMIQYNSTKKRSNSETFSENEQSSKRRILKFKVSEVEFRYQNQEQQTLLQFQISDIDFSRENMHQWSEKQFSMKSMKITDRIFKFTNPTYQTLIQAKGVKFLQLKGRKKNQETRKAIINVNIQDIFINWKPDVLLILMGLMNRHFKSQQKHRVDDDIQQSREDHFKQVYADSKFMYMRENYNQKGKGIFVKEKRDQLSLKSKWMKETMKMSINFDKLEIKMVHRQSHLVMLKIISNTIICEMSICETAKFVKGTIGELDIFDMTGYPQKEYSPFMEYPPYRILTKHQKNDQILMEFRWSSYDPNSFPNQERIDSFIWVEIAPVMFEYYQQITLRMVDYILIQVILLLTQPEMLTVNENLLQQLKKSENIEGEKPVKILFSQYEEIIKRMIHPYFMDMWFKLNDLNLILKAEKTSHIYYNVLINELVFYNTTKKNAVRFDEQFRKELKDFIYEDQYIVQGNNCHFIEIVQKKEKVQELFEPFKIDLILNKLILQDEINIIYPEISKYDRSFLTINKISSIIISHYSRLQYLNINKLVNFNFTFDDQNDQLFIHNFKITKLLSPKPILYEVVIPEIHMTADYNAKENSQDIWKLFKATILDFQMVYRRTKQLDSNMTFSLGITQVKGFQYVQSKKEPIQHDLMTLQGRDQEKYSTEVIIQNKTSGQKLIQMNVGEMKVNVRTGLLQLIFEYTLIEDWVFPTINKFVTELVFYATVQKMTADLCEDPRMIASEMTNKNASQKLIKDILSSKFDFANFKLQGLLCYKFQRKKDITIQEYQQKLQKKQVNFQDFQKMKEVASMNVILNTEIYRAWVKAPSKRKIIEKFTFTMQDKRHLRVADINNCTIKTIAKRTMNIDRGFFKISFKDIMLMNKILQQIGEQRKYINYLNEKTGKLQVNNSNAHKETESSSLENLQLKVDSLSFYLINSRRDIFIPILKVSMNNLNLTKANTFKKDILKGQFSIAVYYFNNNIFRWQPILEKVNLGFHKLTYYQENNSIFGSFDAVQPIMINLSREVFISINETVAGWKKQSEEEEKKYFFEQKEIEPLEFISHYIIRNQTGYPIQIFNERNILIKKIDHCQQIDYELQIQDWDQNEDEIFIGVRIIHPKYHFMTIKNISFSCEKQYDLQPKILGGPNSIINTHSKIVIKPEIKDSKKIMMIKSSKYVYNYLDGGCEIKALPFDHQQFYILPKEIHNQLKVPLYDEMVTEHYRYVGKNGILKIMKKFLVYNYSPIPLQICGRIVKPNEYMGISEKLRIQDVSYKDSLLKVIKNQKQKEYYIFSECYIVDYYGLMLQFQKESKNILKMYSYKFHKNDFAYNIYLLPETEFKFKARLSQGTQAAVSLKTTIGRSNFSLQTKKSLCMFTLNSYLHPLENSHINQFTRIVEITPQYMLSNATKLLIKICQAQSCDSITLNPYERLPFFWQNKTKLKRIKISAYDGVDFWGYSGNLTIDKSTDTIVLRKSADPTMYRIFSIQIEITNTVSFIHIIQSSPKYLISNNVPGTVLQVYQAAIMDEKLDLEYSFPKEFVFNVEYKQEKPFGYELPLESRRLQVKVQLDKSREQFKGLTCDPTTFQDVQNNLDSKTIPLRNQKKSIVGHFYLSLIFQNNIKKLKLRTEVEEEEVENTYEFIVKIPRLGVSFIGFHNAIRKEIIHLMLDSIEFMFSGNSDYSDMDLLISHCRIENELKYNAIFPVLFQSMHTKEAKYFIHFKLSKSAKNSRLIHYIGCSINKSWLTITSEQLQAIQQNLNQIKVSNSKEGEVRQCEMFNSTMPDPQESIYFVQAVIHPLKSNITFRHVNQWGGKLLKTFSSINECPISAEGQKFKHFSCRSFNVFFDLLLKHYQDGLSKMILPMIGNLTILGSPITLVQKIGSGFKDLVELPAEGFETSPLQGGKGVYRGAKSLLTNTFTGAFNTVESLTGSFSNGITLLVDDHQSFARDRQSIKNDRSQHVIGGLANGAKSIANGVKNGFTGFFTEPVKGAQKYGLPGFFLGAAKGIGGLVLKPLSGVFDAASKTAQGIKNTPEFLTRDRQNRFIREHNPRAFYNYYKEYRNYDKFFADIIKIFQQQDKEKYSNLSWCGYYSLISEKATHSPILFVSYEYLFIYDISRKKFLQTIRCENLLGVDLKEQGQGMLKLRVWDHKSKKEGFITLTPDGGCRKLASQINTIIRHFSPNIKFD